MALRTIHLFAGAGGGILADILLGHQPIAAVEIEPYPRGVLLQRQLDGCLPRFPVWDDVTTFRADNPDCAEFFRHAESIRDNLAICGGFPCQNISSAGDGTGITGEKSGLWSEFSRIIGELRPRFVFVENSPMLVVRGLGTVLGDLASMGYDAEWGVLGAHHLGAPHKRDRIWILADARCNGLQGVQETEHFGISWPQSREQLEGLLESERGLAIPTGKNLGIHDGISSRVDRLRAIGNGQVPIVAATAWIELQRRLAE